MINQNNALFIYIYLKNHTLQLAPYDWNSTMFKHTDSQVIMSRVDVRQRCLTVQLLAKPEFVPRSSSVLYSCWDPSAI